MIIWTFLELKILLEKTEKDRERIKKYKNAAKRILDTLPIQDDLDREWTVK